MSDRTDSTLGPVPSAAEHLARLAARLPPGALPDSVIEALAAQRSRFPAWPTPVLADLVGPPSVRLRNLDLRWLHRFEATVALAGWFTRQMGGPAGGPSGLSLLTERAPILGHRGWGPTSAGGSCRIIGAADAALAVNLPRVSDIEAIPAWLEADVGDDLWSDIERVCAGRDSAVMAERAELLGLPIAIVGETDAGEAFTDLPGPSTPIAWPPLVVDLSSMWAGPLCGWYLGRAGADVVKVEASARPDGSRHGAPTFYRRLNADKHVRDLDFSAPDGIAEIRRLVRAADIIIEGSRPRALAQLGVDARAEVARGAIWVSITGHGRERSPQRVGFGDDAAAAANLVVDPPEGPPWFIGDAAADPITGATAAALALGHWWAGQGALLDVALAPTTAMHTGGRRPLARF